MKTRELAKALRSLASLLEKVPNTALEELEVSRLDGGKAAFGDIAVNLSTLVSLSRIDKRQWLAFIDDLKFPIEVRPRDASRDILGKLLGFLEANEIAREQLKTKARTRGTEASPELMKALTSLLRD